MRRLVALVLAVTAMLATSIAAADGGVQAITPSSATPPSATPTAAIPAPATSSRGFLAPPAGLVAETPPILPVALAVNPPINWGANQAASLYIGVTDHLGVRINVASYEYTGGGNTLVAALAHAEDEGDYSGGIRDLGLGWQYFPRRMWDGFSLELDAVARFRDTRVEDEYASSDITETSTTTFAARAMIGWSWMFGETLFVAVSAGVSAGHEIGDETYSSFYDSMSTTAEVSRTVISGEGFMRIGARFKL